MRTMLASIALLVLASGCCDECGKNGTDGYKVGKVERVTVFYRAVPKRDATSGATGAIVGWVIAGPIGALVGAGTGEDSRPAGEAIVSIRLDVTASDGSAVRIDFMAISSEHLGSKAATAMMFRHGEKVRYRRYPSMVGGGYDIKIHEENR